MFRRVVSKNSSEISVHEPPENEHIPMVGVHEIAGNKGMVTFFEEKKRIVHFQGREGILGRSSQDLVQWLKRHGDCKSPKDRVVGLPLPSMAELYGF